MEATKISPFPPTLTRADREFILLAHEVGHSKICRPCQRSILTTFCELSNYHNTGLQLTTDQVLKIDLYPAAVRQLAQAVLDEQLTWVLNDPDRYTHLLHNEWLDLFTRGSPTTSRATDEKWLTKLWFATAGQYTVSDLARGRAYADARDPAAFEEMHLRRLQAGARPLHGAACRCPEARGDWGLTPAERVAEGHHPVLMRYTDHAIKEVYRRFLEARQPAGAGGLGRPPLAVVWRERGMQEGFRALVEEIGPLRQRREGRMERDREIAIAAMALGEVADAEGGNQGERGEQE
jgi:hypothetical protein